MWRFILALTVIAFFQVGCSNQPQDEPSSDRQPAGESTTAENQSPDVPTTPGTSDTQPEQNGMGKDVAKSSPRRENAESQGDQYGPPQDRAEADSTGITPELPARTSLEGRWTLVLSQRGNDFPVALMEFRPADDGSLQAKLLQASQALPDPTLASARVTEESANLTFEMQERTMNFQGTLQKNNTVKGTVLFEGGRCDPAVLAATQAENLDNAQPSQTQGGQALSSMVRSDQPIQGIEDFVAQNPNSPLAMTAYEQMFALAKDQELPASEVEKHAADYIQLAEQWGPRMQQMARINVGIQLAAAEHLPELAKEHLDEAEKHLTEETAEFWKPIIEQGRRLTAQAGLNSQIAQAVSQLKEGTPDEQQQALETLRNLKKQAPFNPRLMYALARHAQQQNRTDQAIHHYAELVALPMLQRLLVQNWLSNQEQHPLPSRTLVELWKQKHGSTEGLEAYLDEVYGESVYSFAEECPESRSRGEGNHIVLCELFTGAQCPPCVAADVATGALEKTYDLSEVIVLRYHQHVPGEDPLVNEDSEARFFNYYNGQATPTLLLNGEKISGAGGFMEQAVDLYGRLRGRIDPLLQQTTPLRINLQAEAKDGALTVSAHAEGLQEPAGDLRLRLVLAEEEVDYSAPNGIRQHEMVVRAMPGGPEGIAPQNGQLRHEGTIPLADFKGRLREYLIAYEQNRDVEFNVKPLDLDDLRLVAFLQNDATQAVLQTASVPVTGTLEYPDFPPAPVSAPKPGPANPFE